MYKPGDAVRIKAGISSETHKDCVPNFVTHMDKHIGKKLEVWHFSGQLKGEEAYTACIIPGDTWSIEKGNPEWLYLPEWLEPWNDYETWDGTEWVKKC